MAKNKPKKQRKLQDESEPRTKAKREKGGQSEDASPPPVVGICSSAPYLGQDPDTDGPDGEQEKRQSANEELETSKEELQSMNEELNTVNSELQGKLNLLASTDIATLFLDAHMRIKLFTPPTGRLLSLIDTDIGRLISDFSAKVANEDLIADAERVLDELRPAEKEVWSEGRQPACYLRRIVPYRTGDNRIEGVVVTFVDITARKQAEAELEKRIMKRTEELLENRNRLQSILETAVDGIVTIDSSGVIDLFNPAVERMFGYRAHEVLGENVKMLMPPPFSDEHDGYLEAYLRTGEAKIIGSGREVVGKHKDGSTFPLDLAVAEIKGPGPRRFVATMRELTEIKRAQAALEREHALSEGIVSTARAIILLLDSAGRIQNFNPYMEELCGYKLEEVRGKDWFTTFIPERKRKHVEGVFARAIQGQRTQGNINSILTKDGREVLVEWHDATLQLPGKPLTLIATGYDVTARDKLQKEFLQAQKMEAVGRLAGGVAHDFNNLLAGILGGLRIALKQLEAEHPAKQVLGQVQEEVERGASITRRLLDFSRIGRPKPGLIDPRETVQAGERLIRRYIGEDIALRVVCDSSNSRIFGDAGEVEQAILNLAINARDAMPRGGTLEIRCTDTDLSAEDVERLGASLQPGPYVVVSVVDSGCGMDEKTRAKALEPFFTTKGPGMGTGLGLSSVAAMMERNKGHLALTSQVGEGTTVRLFFPRAAPAAIGEAMKAVRDAAPEAGNRETILLVEDEPLVRLGVQHILEGLGYVVLAVKDSQTAFAELERAGASFDLLLSDVVLPVMSGPELAAAARKKRPEMRVLFMSAFPSEELVAQGRIAPGTVTLEKPFTDEQVAARIREVLARSE